MNIRTLIFEGFPTRRFNDPVYCFLTTPLQDNGAFLTSCQHLDIEHIAVISEVNPRNMWDALRLVVSLLNTVSCF